MPWPQSPTPSEEDGPEYRPKIFLDMSSSSSSSSASSIIIPQYTTQETQEYLAKRAHLKSVMEDSLEYLYSKFHYYISQLTIKTYKKITYKVPLIYTSKDFYRDIISVEPIDTFEAVIKYTNIYKQRVTALNMACWKKLGGGYLTGAIAQEEDLCRRSSLGLVIHIFEQKDEELVPPKYGGILIEGVNIIKDVEYNYIPDDSQVVCDIICSAALNLRDNSKYKLSDRAFIEVTKKKIKSMLKILIKENKRIIILGAYGCGAYRNNPHIVSEIFYYYLVTKKYYTHFDKIIFAILDTKKEDNNYMIFWEKFMI